MLNARYVIILSTIGFFASFSSVSLAADQKTGGGGLGFSCDVNKQDCRCDGVEAGADCQAMKKNCGNNPVRCIDAITAPGGKAFCFCTMGAAIKAPNKGVPGAKGKKGLEKKDVKSTQ